MGAVFPAVPLGRIFAVRQDVSALEKDGRVMKGVLRRSVLMAPSAHPQTFSFHVVDQCVNDHVKRTILSWLYTKFI
jgi:hypothetical protein